MRRPKGEHPKFESLVLSYTEMPYIEGVWGENARVTEHDGPLPAPGDGEVELKMTIMGSNSPRNGYLRTVLPRAVADDPLIKPLLVKHHNILAMDKLLFIDILSRRYYEVIKQSAILMYKLHGMLSGHRWQAYSDTDDNSRRLIRIARAVKRWLLREKMEVIVKQHGEYEFTTVTAAYFLEQYISGTRAIAEIMTTGYHSHACIFTRNTEVRLPRYVRNFVTTISTNTKGYRTALKNLSTMINEYDCEEGFIIALTSWTSDNQHRITVHTCDAATAHMLQDVFPMSRDTKQMMIDVAEMTQRPAAEEHTYDDDDLHVL